MKRYTVFAGKKVMQAVGRLEIITFGNSYMSLVESECIYFFLCPKFNPNE